MAKRSLEELEKIVLELQQTIETQNKKIQRSEDIREIQNLMGRYEAWHTVGMHDTVQELFARKAPGVSIDIPMFGRWEGYDGIGRCWATHKFYEGDRIGILHANVDANPIIEVAGDGKTAKGYWTAIGVVTLPTDAKDKLQALWSFKRYTVDFIKEDEKWKFWHFRVCPIFGTTYEKSWVEESLSPSPNRPSVKIPDHLRSDKPFTPFYEYRTTNIIPYEPQVPMPYESWDDSMSY